MGKCFMVPEVDTQQETPEVVFTAATAFLGILSVVLSNTAIANAIETARESTICV
jgi:hypothetical protein